jgi:hypothetical protein
MEGMGKESKEGFRKSWKKVSIRMIGMDKERKIKIYLRIWPI